MNYCCTLHTTLLQQDRFIVGVVRNPSTDGYTGRKNRKGRCVRIRLGCGTGHYYYKYSLVVLPVGMSMDVDVR